MCCMLHVVSFASILINMKSISADEYTMNCFENKVKPVWCLSKSVIEVQK